MLKTIKNIKIQEHQKYIKEEGKSIWTCINKVHWGSFGVIIKSRAVFSLLHPVFLSNR